MSQSYLHYLEHQVGTKAELMLSAAVMRARPVDVAVCRHPGFIHAFELTDADANATLHSAHGIESLGWMRRLAGYKAVMISSSTSQGSSGESGSSQGSGKDFAELHRRQLLSPWDLVDFVSVMGRTRHVNLDWPDFMTKVCIDILYKNPDE